MQKNVLIIHGVKGVSAAKKKIIRKFVGVKRTILYLEYEVDHTGQHLIKFIKVLLNWYILSINCIHNIFYKALHILDIKPSAKLELEACCNNLLPLKTRKVSKKRIREYNQVLRGKKKKSTATLGDQNLGLLKEFLLLQSEDLNMICPMRFHKSFG